MSAILDIETTGLEPYAHRVITVGIQFVEPNELGKEPLILFLEEASDEGEKRLLIYTQRVLEELNVIFTWKGSVFDMPFLRARALYHDVDLSFTMKITHIDLWNVVRELFVIYRDFKRTPSLEAFCLWKFKYRRRVNLRGTDIPSLYERWVRERDRSARNLIESHCREDLHMTYMVLNALKPYLSFMFPMGV